HHTWAVSRSRNREVNMNTMMSGAGRWTPVARRKDTAARTGAMGRAAAVFVAVLLLPAASLAGEVTEQSTKAVTRPAGARVVIVNRSGDSSVRAWDRNDVEVEVVKRVRMRDDIRAHDLLKKLSVEVEVTGSEVRVKAHYPEREVTGGVFGLLSSDRLRSS